MKNQHFSFGDNNNYHRIPKLASTNSPKYTIPITSQQKYKTINNQCVFPVRTQLSRVNSGNKERQTITSKSSNKYLKFSKEQLIILILQLESKLQSYKLKVSGNKDKMVELSQLLFQYEQTHKELSEESKGNILKFQNYIKTINDQHIQKINIIQKQNTQIKEQIQVYKNCLRKLQLCIQIKDKDLKTLKQKQKSQTQQNIKMKEQIQLLKKQNITLVADNEKLKEQNKIIKMLNQTQKGDYEKRILQKQELIKKMSQFNNQICEKMIYQKYQKSKDNLGNYKQKNEVSIKYKDSDLSRARSQRDFIKKNFTSTQQNQNLQEINYQLTKKNQILTQQNQVLKEKVDKIQQKIHVMQQIIQQKQNKIDNLLYQSNNNFKIQNYEFQDMLYTDRTVNTLKISGSQKLKDQNYQDFILMQQNLKQRFSYQETQKSNIKTKKLETKQQKMLRLERNKIFLLQQMLKAQKGKNKQLSQRVQTIQNNYKYNNKLNQKLCNNQSDSQMNNFIKNIQMLVRKKYNQNNQSHNYLCNNTDQSFYQNIIKLCQLAKKEKVQGRLRVSQVKQSINNDFKVQSKNKNLIWSRAKRQTSPNWPSSSQNTEYIVELKKYMKNK